MLNFSLSSLFYLIPLYFLVISPLLRQLFPADETYYGSYDEEDVDEDTSLNLNHDILSIEDGTPFTCDSGSDAYRVHILSQAPLVIYIEGFLSGDEADHLVNVRYAPQPSPASLIRIINQSSILLNRPVL